MQDADRRVANGDGRGSVGQHANSNNLPDLNPNAIDTNVETLSASAASGIYVSEFDDVTVTEVTVLVFASDFPDGIQDTLSDLTTTDAVTNRLEQLLGPL